MDINRLDAGSDIDAIVTSVDPSEWDAANAFSPLDAASLRAIADNSDYVYLLARNGGVVVGVALAVILHKTDGTTWLYVDELDTHPRHRRQGIASALMQELFAIGRARGCDEVWLGAQVSNDPACAFYDALAPDEREVVVGFTYDLG